MERDDPKDPRYRGRPQGAGDSRDHGRQERRDRSGAGYRSDDDHYEQRDSRRSGDPSAPRSRSKTRDLHERSSSASNGRGDARDDYGRRSGSSRSGSSRSGSGSSRDDYGDGRRSGSGSSRGGNDDGRRSDSGSSRDDYGDGRRSGSGSSRGGYDDSRRDGSSRNGSSSRSGDSRRAYDQADAPDRYDSPRSRGRSSTRSFADEERTRPPSVSGSRDARGGGSSRAPRGSSADDWGRGGNGRSSRGLADGAAGWGVVADGFSIGDDSPWPDEPQEWSTWSDNGPKSKGNKANRGKSETPATGGGIKARFKRAWAKPMQRGVIIFVLVSLGLCTISSLLTGIVGASSVDPALWNAYVGYSHLKTGETLLKSLTTGSMNTSTVREAEQYFLASQQDFTASHDAMLKIPSFAETAPFVGNKVQVGIRLTALAATFSQIAAVGSDAGSILVGAVANPFGSTVANGSALATPTPGSSTTKPVATATPSTGLTPANLTQIQKDLKTINDLLTAAAPQINAIQPGDLSFQPKLESEFNQFRAMLPQIHSYLDEATTIMGIAGPMLGIGHPAYYFVELLDSTEIRPGGGFIGNYGTMIVKGGVLAGLHVQDVDLLDQPFTSAKGCIPMPTRYLWFTYSEGISCWSLRDSNFEPDFPTSAQYGEQNYTLEGGPYTFQGVVAITPWLIEKFIALTGPIAVPEVKDPTTGKTVVVTSTNLVDMIHQFQLGAGHGSNNIPDPASQTSQRKAFTGFLFKHFMEKLKTVIKNNKTGVLKTILSALATKDVQVYFNNPVAEGLLKKYNMASVVLAPKTGDSQLVADANVIANKANNFITYTLNDTVTINNAGDATHNLTLTYNWPKSAAYDANSYGSSPANKTHFQDYLRVFVPPQAILNSTSGWNYTGVTTDFGRIAFSGFMDIYYPGTQVVSFNYTVPHAATQVKGVWTYPLLYQVESGHAPNDEWAMNVSIKPDCGKVASATAPWTIASSGAATLKMSLAVDKSYTMTYSCAG